VLATTSTPAQPITTMLGGPSTFDPFQVNAHNIPADTWQAKLITHGTSDVYVVDNKFASGVSTGWHSHPEPDPGHRRHDHKTTRRQLLRPDLLRPDRVHHTPAATTSTS